jgi:membrane protein implicated in regulation of membrane protease activity
VTEPGTPAPLPKRPPRPLVVHYGIDSAVVFILLLLFALTFTWSILLIAVIALVAGLALAPWTRRREMEALAKRPDPPSAP